MSGTVDSKCTLSNVRLYENYSATLNLSDISKNSNKFYIIQIITDGQKFYVWTRYGRVGENGTGSCKVQSSQYEAVSEFMKVFKSKTGNVWRNGKNEDFKLIPGKYCVMNLEQPDIVSNKSSMSKVSNLHQRVISLLNLISNKQTVSDTIKLLHLDEKKMPLGKISSAQILQGHDILTYISELLQYVSMTNVKTIEDVAVEDILIKASSMFWTYIPYASSRNISPPIIGTQSKCEELSSMLDILSNIRITAEICTSNTDMDSIYTSLGITIAPLDKDGDMWKHLNTYVQNTHASTHKYRLRIKDIYVLNKTCDDTTKFDNIPNHQLLFHGSHLVNFMGIMSEGLRIPLSTQVSNGSVLGKGIYFANSISKSFNYCRSDETNNQGCVLVCEVAVGNPQVVYGPNETILPSTYMSRFAQGKSSPNEKDYIKVDNVTIPYGKLITKNIDSSFLYDEFVVFSKDRYKFRYLLQLESY